MTDYSVTVIFRGVANIDVEAENMGEALTVAEDKFGEGLPNKYDIIEWEPQSASYIMDGEEKYAEAGCEEDNVSDDGKYTVDVLYRGGETYDVQAESEEDAIKQALALLMKEPFSDDIIEYGEESIHYIDADGKEAGNEDLYTFDCLPSVLDYIAAAA